MRRVLLELRPDAFEEEDINELLEQLANSVKLRSNMDVSFKTSGLGKPGRQIKESVYRITQEALNNAIKHAEAKKIDISLEYRGKKLYLKITDDGKGFDIKNVAKNKYGLYIMNERANSINAGLKITSNIDKGTEILLSCSME